VPENTTSTAPEPAGAPSPAGRLVWIDCEMTGLDLGADALVEIACLVTDADLAPLDGGVSLVIRPPAQALAQMSEFVTGMHRESGLLPLIAAGVPLAEAEQAVLAYIRAHVPEPRKAPLAGSSVYVDRGFLARDMPAVDAHLHYRLVDVSSIKELVRRWYPKVYYTLPAKTGNHRALGDVLDSIGELRHYREQVFRGPDAAPRAVLDGAVGRVH
jgi:oligoribonuclease